MENSASLTDPLPLFYHEESKKVLYVAHGASPLVFSIYFEDVTSHVAITEGPVMQPTTHPFGLRTGVSPLSEDAARRALGQTHVLEPGAFEAIFSLWTDFCDEVAERVHEGEELGHVLNTAWVFEDAADVDLHDQAAAASQEDGLDAEATA